MPKSPRTIWSCWRTTSSFFPQYKAVFLYRLALAAEAIAALRSLEGTFDEKRMIRLNAEAERTKDYARAARLVFQADGASPRQPTAGESPAQAQPLDVAPSRACRHLAVAVRSSSAFRSASRPAAAARSARRSSRVTGAVQTIPSLALLALLVPVPFFGISAAHRDRRAFSLRTASDRAQHRHRLAGYRAAHPRIRDRPRASNPAARFWKIYLPIASRTILGRNQNQRGDQHRHRHARRA